MDKTKLAVLISGRGSTLKVIMDAIEIGYLDKVVLRAVIANKDALGLKYAKEGHIPNYIIKNDDELLKILEKYEVDLVALAGYDQIVGKEIVDKYKNKIMNIHPALLPSFPNTMHAQQKAFDYGVKITGCTVHFAINDVDAGPIIIQAAVPVKDTDTEKTLNDRILEHEHIIYPKAIKMFSEGRLRVVGKKVFINGDIEAIDIVNAMDEMKKIGVSKECLSRYDEKIKMRAILVRNVTPREAMILKQEMLSLGGDCAVPKECVLNNLVPVDVILIGNNSQVGLLIQKLKTQTFSLPVLAEKLEELK